MKHLQARKTVGARRCLATLAACSLALLLVVFSHAGQAQSQPGQDGRPRRTAQQQQTPVQQQKPKPTPTPAARPAKQQQPPINVLDEKPPEMADPVGAEINEGDVVTVDTNLVNLNVRVIDRFNRPINGVRQD